jgi:pimeloyl-ACP methyl ester carboxylesterase
MLKERSIDTGTTVINFAEGPPSGPPLVLLHGLPSRWQRFLPILPTLMLQWHIYALDFRGQGKSGRTPGQYQAKYYVNDVIQFLQHQFNEPATLFGCSAAGTGALVAAARQPKLVRAVIAGDSPIDMEVLLEWMTSEGFQNYFTELRKLAGLEQSITKIAEMIAEIPIQIPGQDTKIKYGAAPGVDMIEIQQLAITLKHMDPGVLEYHAEGRAVEFFEGFELDASLPKITSPVLLLQGNPALGGMMTSDSVKHVQSILPDVNHVLLNEVGHDLGLESWEIGPLLRAIMSFLETV